MAQNILPFEHLYIPKENRTETYCQAAGEEGLRFGAIIDFVRALPYATAMQAGIPGDRKHGTAGRQHKTKF